MSNDFELDPVQQEIIKKSEQAVPDAYENKDPMTNYFIGICRAYFIKGYNQCRQDMFRQINNNIENNE